MKLILFLLLALSTVLAQRQRSVLYDFRKDNLSPEQKITPATQRDVLAKVFRRYLTDPKKCISGAIASSRMSARQAA